jgi:hypothetical protein
VQFVGILGIAVSLFSLGSPENFFVGLTIVNAAQAIFISAVYHRVQGEEVQLVSNDQVSELFERKSKKMW